VFKSPHVGALEGVNVEARWCFALVMGRFTFPVDTMMYMQHKFVQALPCEQFILPRQLIVLTLTTEIDSRPFLQPGVLSDETL
jgi:hypothetical protein